MALTPSLIFNFRDKKGKTSTTKIHVPTGLSFAELRDTALAAAQVLANLSTAEITDVSVSVGIDLSLASLKLVATEFGDWWNKALVLAKDTASGLYTRFFIPTYAESNTLPNSDVLDSADVQVAALYTLIEDGLDDGGIAIRPVTARDQNLDLVTSGTEIFRKS